MCFFSRLTLSVSELKQHFRAEPLDMEGYIPSERFNAFTHPKTPVIANDNPSTMRLFGWGLMPSWAKDEAYRKHTLNARLETLTEKPSFKPYINNRCLILANGFYEWQWLDPKGVRKQAYLITTPASEAFAFAGIWNVWKHPQSGALLPTYTVITRPANALMATIHNSQQRMPFILRPEEEAAWLQGAAFTYGDVALMATDI